LKTGTVEIRQHVETTPTVYKNFVVGTILAEKYHIENMRPGSKLGTFTILGEHHVFKFLSGDYLTICAPGDFTASSLQTVVDDPALISYLRDRAQKHLGGIIQEIEEGVFDD